MCSWLRLKETREKYDMRKSFKVEWWVLLLEYQQNLTLSSKLSMALESGLPTVRISGTNNNNNGDVHEILQFRHKIEWSGTAIRNYVEKRPGLYNYARNESKNHSPRTHRRFDVDVWY